MLKFEFVVSITAESRDQVVQYLLNYVKKLFLSVPLTTALFGNIFRDAKKYPYHFAAPLTCGVSRCVISCGVPCVCLNVLSLSCSDIRVPGSMLRTGTESGGKKSPPPPPPTTSTHSWIDSAQPYEQHVLWENFCSCSFTLKPKWKWWCMNARVDAFWVWVNSMHMMLTRRISFLGMICRERSSTFSSSWWVHYDW